MSEITDISRDQYTAPGKFLEGEILVNEAKILVNLIAIDKEKLSKLCVKIFLCSVCDV